MSVPLKIGIGAIAISIVGISGTGIYKLFVPETIRDKLYSEGLQIIPEGDAKWDILLKNHEALEKKGGAQEGKPKTIVGLQIRAESQTMKNDLYKECVKLLNTSLNESEDLPRKEQEAKDWCTTTGAGLNVNVGN